MKYRLDNTGIIISRIAPAPGTEGRYSDYLDGDVPRGATHFRNGAFLTKPPQSSVIQAWDDAAFQWVDDAGLAGDAVRAKRDLLLTQSDWTQLPDVAPETSALWTTYRQALRDVTKQPGFPFDVMWPVV